MKYSDYFVFDIETVAFPIDSFDESLQEYLLRNTQSDEEREKKIREMALSPFCAKIACIGLVVIHNQDGIYELKSEGALALDESLTDGIEVRDKLTGGGSLIYSNEQTMLRQFWRLMTKYDKACLVSFNGRSFDAPFLMLRSALRKIRPSRNLMDGTKFSYNLHIDLAEELTYKNFNSSGPLRRFNMNFYTKSFGIESPKSQGLDGSNVGKFFEEGRTAEIAEYCLRDVHATWELFQTWEQYLHF